MLTFACDTVRAVSVDAPDTTTLESLSASKQAEFERFNKRMKALKLQPPSKQRGEQISQEVQRHLGENKRISMEGEALRRQNIDSLKKKWNQVETDWQAECSRHENTRKQLEKMPDGPDKAARIDAENNRYRSRSKEIAVQRNNVHEGVIRQANVDVRGGSKNVSGRVRQTAGTKIGDPNFRGMHGDFDAGGGYRTTEKAAKILNEMGVKSSSGGKVRLHNGVLETSADFGMTINADAGLDRVGSSGHQAQVKQAAGHGETYISESGGKMQSKPLKDHLATLDHTKKAMHGLHENPGKLVGGSQEGQTLAKGALKAADQAGLSQKTLEGIARQRGLKDPGSIMERLGEIKAGRAKIPTAEEAAKLQAAARDILNASEASLKSKAASELKRIDSKISDLEARGSVKEAQRLRQEVADYRAKSHAASETLGHSPDSKVKGEVKPKSTGTGRKLISGAGLILGIYGIYEGYKTASKEMEQKKKEETESQEMLRSAAGKIAGKTELALRTLWHGLGFGGMAEIGSQAGKEAFEQYKKDIADGKISPDSWREYLKMKGTAVLTGVFRAGKMMTYDMVKKTLVDSKEAVTEGGGAVGDLITSIKDGYNEKKTHEERSKKIYDMLIKKGASELGAKRAADAVKEGDYSEAKRLDRVLEGKLAVKRTEEELKNDPEGKRLSRSGREKKTMKREQSRKEEAARENATDKQIELREIVIAKLQAKGLPTAVSLVDRLTAILEREGMKALDAAIAEMSGMQGTFKGKAFGTAFINLVVKGSTVTGSYKNTISTSQSAGKTVITVTVTQTGTIQGDVELTSGSISFKMTGTSTSVINPGGKTTSIPMSATKFSGSFTGNGYKGTSSGVNWSVSR